MDRPRVSGKFTALSIGAIASAILLALAVLFANSYSTGLVTANARILHSTNALLGSSAVVRAANNQAALFAREFELGVASQAARDLAIAEARRTIDTFEGVYETVDPALGQAIADLDVLVQEFVDSSAESLDVAESGDYEGAFDLLGARFTPTWNELRDVLRTNQSRALAQIDETQTLAVWVSGATRFLALFLIPLMALLVFRRITKTRARERRITYEASLAYERKLNASKDELIAGVSHQLRTPLTGIYGMADVLSDDGGLDSETTREFAEAIRTEAYALDRMVADLLATARLDAGSITFKSEEFVVLNSIQRAVEPARRAGDQVEVVVEGLYRVTGDPDRVVHILRNLISNANKHGRTPVTITGSESDEMVSLVVQDAGTSNLDPSVIFSDFANGGSGALTAGSVGLGLSVARRLAQGMNGDLTYEPGPNSTRFILTLPASVSKPAPELASSVNAE